MHSLLGTLMVRQPAGQVVSLFMSTLTTCIHPPLIPPHLSFMLQITLRTPFLPLIQYSPTVPLVSGLHLYISLQEVAGLACIIPSAKSVQAIPTLNTNSRIEQINTVFILSLSKLLINYKVPCILWLKTLPILSQMLLLQCIYIDLQ